jgi:hypothetical protein
VDYRQIIHSRVHLSPAKKIRFFGKIGFLTLPKNPIFWKNRIFNPAKKSDFLEKSDF